MQVKRHYVPVALWFVASVFACISGCGSSTAEVTGKITMEGKAPQIDGLEIAFLAPDGQMVTAPIGKDGAYATVVPVGEAKVNFIYIAPQDKAAAGKRPRRVPIPGKEWPSKEKSKEPIPNPLPERLRDSTKSQLTCQVKSGQANIFDYDITP